ncbi:unnamed protein product [Phytophthora lilii]|uniref:Unnamed protein product n=1 Tax=Phytophthora lilii TaxID=2077276 RepID=A0A9W6U4F6_9STRA|nr:unnamed protein product [Phytophthora lilii]
MFSSSKLTLRLARKVEGGKSKWLKSDPALKPFLKKGRQDDSKYVEMIPIWTLDDDEYFGTNFEPGPKRIHVLVELPPLTTPESDLWLAHGAVTNALVTRGIRCRLYRLAGTYLGYYDPARRSGEKNSALWYECNTLHIHICSRQYDPCSEEKALQFDNALQEEPATLGSPLSGQEVTTSVERVEGVPTELQRIYFVHYDAQESESPQDFKRHTFGLLN